VAHQTPKRHLPPHPNRQLLAQPSGDLVRYYHQTSHRRGTFRSLRQLINTINTYITKWNHDSKPFAWTVTPNEIITKVRLIHQDFKKLLDNNNA
jgi:hypothetical protein